MASLLSANLVCPVKRAANDGAKHLKERGPVGSLVQLGTSDNRMRLPDRG